MFRFIEKIVLPRIIGIMYKKEILNEEEHIAQQMFMIKARVGFKKRKTEKPVIVAMIGLIGSGKSSVAQELAKHIGATVIESDAIRVELRKQGEQYKHARMIAENATLEATGRGSNVVIDSDFIDAKKRASLHEKARKASIRVFFIRTFCDSDVMIGRIISAGYHDRIDDFFGGAASSWHGNGPKGGVVKLREMWRRTPSHYRWINMGGGRWEIKKPPCAVLADIDTTNPVLWKREVEKCAEKLLEQ